MSSSSSISSADQFVRAKEGRGGVAKIAVVEVVVVVVARAKVGEL